MVCFRREIARDNWDLGKLPIIANGVPVDGTGTAGGVPPPRTEAARVVLEAFAAGSEIPDLSAMDEALAELGGFDTGGEGEIWGDDRAVLASAPISSEAAPSEAASIGRRILDNPAIKLATAHASGVPDEATARQNMLDTADGHPARRSSYRGAPGGTVALDIRMLKGLLALGARYSVAISELCGGSHNPNSRHYAGLAFDINEINGRHVSLGHRDAAAVMAMCRALGATEVLGPGDRNHSTHVHAA